MWIYRTALRQNSHMQACLWFVLNVSTPSLPSPRPARLVQVESFYFRHLRTLLSLRAEHQCALIFPWERRSHRPINDVFFLPPIIFLPF